MTAKKLNQIENEKEFLEQCLDKVLFMMKKTDLVLSGLAGNATCAAVRRLYIEALVEARQKRERIKEEFRLEFAQMLGIDESSLLQSKGATDDTEPESGSSESLKVLLESGQFDVEEITISGGQDFSEEEVKALDDGVDDHFSKFVRKMRKGTWLEFRQNDGKVALRARFTWVNSVTQVYFFIDQRGLKVAEKKQHELANDLRRGRAKVVKDVPLLDKAVSNLMFGIRKHNVG